MSSPEVPPPDFTVTLMPLVRERLREFHFRSAMLRRREAYLDALRAILARLQRDPEEFGEPLRDYHHARLELRRGGVAPLILTYTVHRDERRVFVRDVEMLS